MTTVQQTSEPRPAVDDEVRYEHEAIARVVDALEAEFAGRVPAGAVAETVAAVRERFRDAKVREFVPLMVERRAHARLAALARYGADLWPTAGSTRGEGSPQWTSKPTAG